MSKTHLQLAIERGEQLQRERLTLRILAALDARNLELLKTKNARGNIGKSPARCLAEELLKP